MANTAKGGVRVSKKDKIISEKDENSALMRKMKLLDALSAFVISLIIFAIAYGLLLKHIGVFAIFGACILSVCGVFVLMRLTGLKSSSVIKFSAPKKSETFGAALILGASLIVSIPPILFSQLIAPRLAATSFNIYSIVGPSGAFGAILAVIFIALCENFLFDGYIYSRLSAVKSVFLRGVLISLMAAVMRFDVYAFSSMFIASAAAFIARRETGSLTLPLVIRLFFVSYVMATSALSASASELVGEAMGAVQIIGLTLIFLGMALPVATLAFAAFGKLRQNGKIIGFSVGVLALILIAAGCGVSSL